MKHVVLLVSLFWLISQPATHAQEWTRFRGPNGSGVSIASSVPTKWTDEDYNWQVDLPGVGHSSPVLWGDLLVVTCGIEEDGTRLVLGLDAGSGKQRWRADSAETTRKRKHKLNSLASATPAVDEQHIYVCWATADAFLVAALNHQGREVWRVDLGPFKTGHGDGVSPMVHGDVVIVAKEHEGDSEIVALDCSTGDVRWRVDRKSRTTWATPCVFRADSRRPELILANYEHGITSLDPKTGALNWEADVFDKGHFESTIASPIATDDLVLGVSGYLSVRQEVIAVRPDRKSDQATAEQVYCIDRGVGLTTTPLVAGDLLFLWSDEGIVSCADVQSGEVHWRKRIGGTFYASPICIGDHIYNISAAGTAIVVAAEKEYKLVSRQELGEPSHSTPAVANGVMYLRTFSKLFSLGGVSVE
jgi:outer membrane protein assembly factor BamB